VAYLKVLFCYSTDDIEGYFVDHLGGGGAGGRVNIAPGVLCLTGRNVSIFSLTSVLWAVDTLRRVRPPAVAGLYSALKRPPYLTANIIN
jgi:hypothetical protein